MLKKMVLLGLSILMLASCGKQGEQQPQPEQQAQAEQQEQQAVEAEEARQIDEQLKADRLKDSGAETPELDQAIADAIFKYSEGKYKVGEVKGEGHIVLGTAKEGDNTLVYALTMYGEYATADGAMVKIDGHATIPMVLVLDGQYQFVEGKEPIIGDLVSLEALFPDGEMRERITSLSIDDYTALTRQEANYVSAYLKKNGLEMVIKQ